MEKRRAIRRKASCMPCMRCSDPQLSNPNIEYALTTKIDHENANWQDDPHFPDGWIHAERCVDRDHNSDE